MLVLLHSLYLPVETLLVLIRSCRLLKLSKISQRPYELLQNQLFTAESEERCPVDLPRAVVNIAKLFQTSLVGPWRSQSVQVCWLLEFHSIPVLCHGLEYRLR